jgi:hypothetical protein
MKEERVFIQAGKVIIEGLLAKAPGEKAVIVTHPHPLYGGDMNNSVVAAVVEAYSSKGYTTLRFNFRGVGQSEGKYDEGIGCGGDGDCPGHCGDGTICLGNCPAECPRETCVTEPRCTGLGSCAKTYTEVDYCNLSLMSVFDCPPGQFRCDNYACIDPLYVCDGVYDCTDGSDELGPTCGG